MIVFSKRNKLFAWFLTSLVVALVGLFQLVAPAIWAGEEAAAVAENKSAPCKGLKPYNNINELLYQIYINFNSDCLFKMKTDELEKVWGTKILDETRYKPRSNGSFNDVEIPNKHYKSQRDPFYIETEFYNKPYKSEKDAFYIKISRDDYTGHIDRFRLKITKEYSEKNGTLFIGGTPPPLLPKPVNYYDTPFASNCSPRHTYDGPSEIFCAGLMGWAFLPNEEQPVPLPFYYETALDAESCVPPLFTRELSELKRRCAYYTWENVDGTRRISLDDPFEVLIPDEQSKLEVYGDRRDGPCKGLRPVNNIDELLYQIYINLDSDCLFKMTPEELETRWQIYVQDSRKNSRLNPYNKDFKLTIIYGYDGMSNEFYISAYNPYSTNGSILPDGKFPRLLPKPQEIFTWDGEPTKCEWAMTPPYYLLETNEIKNDRAYYWLSPDKKRMMYLGKGCSPLQITIINSLLPFIESD